MESVYIPHADNREKATERIARARHTGNAFTPTTESNFTFGVTYRNNATGRAVLAIQYLPNFDVHIWQADEYGNWIVAGRLEYDTPHSPDTLRTLVGEFINATL